MALPVVPQRLALQDLEELLQQNRRDHRILLLAILARRRRQRQREGRGRKRWWVKPWTSIERRIVFGPYYNLIEELDRECQEDYRSYLRMDRNMFGEVLERIAPMITKCDR